MSSRLPLGRVVLVAVLCAMALAACGRRGPLETPPDPSARADRGRTGGSRAAAVGDTVSTRAGRAAEGQANAPGQAQVSDGGEAIDEVDDTVLPSPVPSPARPGGRKRGFVIPKEPFILDPLL